MSFLEKKITVIVPIYNAEAYLSKCIESILNQTYSNLEIILIDDGSTDQSGKICDDFAKQDRRIEVYHTINRGLVAARKWGLERSTGEFIGFVDADDYIEPNMFEVLFESICNSDADFVHTGYIEENENDREFIEVLDYNNGLYELQSDEDREDFLIRFVLRPESERFVSYSIWSKLYRSELIKSSYFLLQDDQQYGEDLYSLCLCILQSRRIYLKRCAMYHYVARNSSMSHLQKTDYYIKEMELIANLIKTIRNYNISSYNRLKEHICYFIKSKSLHLIEKSIEEPMLMPHFYFKNVNILRKKRIIIYGAGVVGQNYYAQFCRYNDIEIVAWFDSNWQRYQLEYTGIVGIDRIFDYVFDKIIIAVKDEVMAKEIQELLLGYGQPAEKIIWEKPENILEH